MAKRKPRDSFLVRRVKGNVGVTEIPWRPGELWLLLGRNGCGKSFTIEGLLSLIDKSLRTNLGPSDNEDCGEVFAPGTFRVRLGLKSTASGVMECEILEDDINLAKLVDPGYTDQEVNDKHRLRGLAKLANATRTAEQWREAFGVGPDIELPDGLIEDDPVSTGEAFRGVFHESRRKSEAEAQRLEGEIATLVEQNVDTKPQAYTAEQIDDRRDARRQAELSAQQAEQKVKNADAAEVQRGKDRERLARTKKTLPDIGQLRRDESAEKLAAANMVSRVNRLREHIAELQLKLEQDEPLLAAKEQARDQAKKAREQAEGTKAEIDELERGLETPIERPSTEEIETLSLAAVAADEAVTEAVDAQAAYGRVAQIAEKQTSMKAANDKAEQRAEWASQVDPTIEQAVADAGLKDVKTKDGRLCVATDRSDCEPFGELSKGERTSFLLHRIGDCRGEGVVVVIPQELIEGLDPDAMLDALAVIRERKLAAIGAMATRGELRCEEFTGDWPRKSSK